MVRVDDSDHAEARELDQTLVRVREAVADDRPDFTYHQEMLRRHTPTAVRGSLQRSPLNRNRKEVKVVEQGCKATFPHNGAGELLGNLLQRLGE